MDKDATEYEPKPKPSFGDVWLNVIDDMKSRRKMGIEKYGTPLQPNNGRNALVDAYQEVLDLAVYLKQKIIENSALDNEGVTMKNTSKKQLGLTEDELLKIGFEKKIYLGDGLNSDSVVYEIETINGCFCYNIEQQEFEYDYVWYHKTIIGDGANYIHLDIQKLSHLFILLDCFRVEYNGV